MKKIGCAPYCRYVHNDNKNIDRKEKILIFSIGGCGKVFAFMNKRVIFADCFNTVILRNKSPKEAMWDWACRLGAEYSVEPAFFYNGFYKYQSKLFMRHKLKTGEGEFTFDEVLEKLCEELFAVNFFKCVEKSDFLKSAKELYFKAEGDSHYLNKEVVRLLKDYKADGKRVYIVSDFYCGKEVVCGWLERLGVKELFDGVFVSCDYLKSKRTGKLYKAALSELGVDKKSVLMTGDNRKADCIMARRAGLGAKRIKSKPKKSEKDLKILARHGANYLKINEVFKEYGKKYNYSNYAFPLYLFLKRIYEAAEKSGVKDLFFMSREGQLLKKLFDNFCAENGIKINTHYLYVSRNSVLAASLAPLKEESFEVLLRSIFNMNIRRFLQTLDFSNEDIQRISAGLSVKIDKKSRDFVKSKEFKALVENPTFKALYEEKRRQQRAAFKAYLDSFGVDFKKDGMYLVDVGWYGTIQDYIAKFFDVSVETYGYYVGTFGRKKIAHSNKIALFYSRPNNRAYGNGILRHRRLDYEQVCRADHNRVKGYEINDGGCRIIYANEVDEGEAFRTLVEPLQRQICAKYAKLCKLDFKYFSNMENTVIKMFYKMFCKQSAEDFEWLRQAEDCCFDSFARIGFTAKRFKDGLRIFAYKALDLGFKIKFALKVKLMK